MRVKEVKGVIRLLLLCVFTFLGISSYGQTDTEFWFSVPEINRYHYGGTETNPQNAGYPVYLRLTAGSIAAEVTISMPANKAFNAGSEYTFRIDANKTYTLDLAGLNFIGDDRPGVTKFSSIENRLKWTTSNLTGAKPYINKNSKGVHIVSSAPITAYYEISAHFNMDLLSLKGKNALGREFFIPFQTSYATSNQYNYIFKPYSSFDIVATEDNTCVQITPTQDVFVYPNDYHLAGTPFKIWLNKGETAIIPPYGSNSSRPNAAGESPYKTSNEKRLAGTKVEVLEGGNISIISRDDLVGAPGGVDFVGDQLVPTKLAGNDYAIVRGRLGSNEEHAYVVATQNTTQLEVNGLPVGKMLDAGQCQIVDIPLGQNITTIKGDKPVLVYHLSGFGGATTQVAGALIPTITKCSGSTRVGFNRTKDYEGGKNYDFVINLLVRKGGEKSFVLTDKDGKDVTNLIPSINNPATYREVGTTPPYSDWLYASITANSISAGKDEAYLLSNTGDVFHLGILNGNANADAFYGYFSDFNELKINANVAGIGVGEASYCLGSKINLYASGGTKYKWSPADDLNNATIYNPVADIKTIGVKNYTVEVSGACGMKDTKEITLQILAEVKASFSVDNISGCSPLKVNFTNTSTNTNELTWKFGDGTENKSSMPNLNEKIEHSFVNNTKDPITYTVTLVAKSKGGCGDIVEKKITVFPSVEAKFKRLDPSLSYCSPRTMKYENISPKTPLPDDDITYIWNFDDGQSLKTKDINVSHDFSAEDTKKKRYNVELTMVNKYGCKSVDTDTVDVYGKVKASFLLDKTSGCPNPNFSTVVTDNSKGIILSRNWSWGGFSSNERATKNVFDISTTSTSDREVSRTIKLDIVGAGGCADHHEEEIKIHPYVNAFFTMPDNTLCNGDVLKVENTSSPGATEYFWEFGDGATSKESSPSHIYENSTFNKAEFSVKLTASSVSGCSSTYVPDKKVTVYSNFHPSFEVRGFGGCAPFNATLINTSQGNAANVYDWDFESDANFDISENKLIAERSHSFTNTTTKLKDYKVTLRVTNEGGCSSSTSGVVLVYPQPVADFAIDNMKGCNPLPVKFTASTSVADYRYTWDFGDKDVGRDFSVSHTYNNSDAAADKTFTAKLKVSSIYGCFAERSADVTVHPYLSSGFTAVPQTSCTPFDVRIEPSSVGATGYEWSYGDGRTEKKADGSAFTVRYDNAGAAAQTYQLGLVATNAGGACRTAVREVPITVWPRLVADGAFSVDDRCAGKVTFTNASKGATGYVWDFGDGQSSSVAGAVPQAHAYDNRTAVAQEYRAVLTATNAQGCTSRKELKVPVVPRVESAFTYEVLERCTPMKLRLTNGSLNGTEYLWDYGHTIGGKAQQEDRTERTAFDRVLDSENPSAVQRYTLTLTATDAATGCRSTSSREVEVYPRVVPAFQSAVTDRCQGAVLLKNGTTGASSYTWTFGDQSSSYTTDQLADVAHTYLNRSATDAVFTAKLTAENALGCRATASQDVTVVPRVESGFTLEELEGCTPMRVKLTNTSLNGHLFSWDYGHTIGGKAQQEDRTERTAFDRVLDSESADAVQEYPITLKVQDKNTLCSSTFTLPVKVYPRVQPSFTADRTSGCSNLTVSLTNASTGGPLSYSWDFGDGQSVQAADGLTPVQHTYVNRTGATQNRQVVLTATNGKGCRATASRTIGVFPKVEAAFSFAQPSRCTPFPIDVTNGSLNGTEYRWDFGHAANGARRDTVSLTPAGFRTYVYNDGDKAQTYTVTLTARDAVTGCSDVATRTVEAQPEVRSGFSVSADRGCTPLTVGLTNASSGATGYEWSFGDGTTSRSASPAPVKLSNSDTERTRSYAVSLTATNADGCTSTSTRRVDVYPKVVADFSLDRSEGCTPLAVQLRNASPSPAYRYEWELGSNGGSTAEQLPALTFTNSTADYSVQEEALKLRVYYKGDATCSQEATRTVRVFPGTRSDFTVDVPEACSPLRATFTNTSESYKGTASSSWSFGSLGSSGERSPSYAFTNLSTTATATFPVTLRSTSEHGCTDATTKSVVVRPNPKAQLAIATASGCAPFSVEVQNLSDGAKPTYRFWLDDDQGGAVERNGKTPVQFQLDNLTGDTKETRIWLEATSDFGCKDVASQRVYTHPHVTSSFGFTPADAGCNPLTVGFTNGSQNAHSYTWSFGDGTTSGETAPSHVFLNGEAQDRTFRVELLATSNKGCQHRSVKDFVVYASPVAHFTIEPPLRTYPDASFLLKNLTVPKSQSWTYEWDFGDGSRYVGIDPPVHTYATWGDKSKDYRYPVHLKVSNGSCQSEAGQDVYLKPAVPVSAFVPSTTQSCAPLKVRFSQQAKYHSALEWDFGDGTTSTEDSPAHEYAQPGKYHVQLKVTGDGGTSYAYSTLESFANPVASFKVSPSEAMLPEARVQLFNTSVGASSFAWDFGDVVGTSTEKNPSYSYRQLGSYDVRLQVTSDNGCTNETVVKAAVKVVGEGVVKFPNAFIPNPYGGNGGSYEKPDHKNEVFHPISEGVVNYKLLVYNRWGEKLFESSDISTGWDGYYKGKLCDQGVYVYRAMGRFTNGKTFDVRGDVTLLR